MSDTQKTSNEAYLLNMDFSTIPAFGAAVSSNAKGTTTVKVFLNGVEQASMVEAATYLGTTVQALVYGGVKGEVYKVAFHAADDNGQFYERFKYMEVR